MTDRRPAISAQIRALVEEDFAPGGAPGARGTARVPLHVPSYGAEEVNEALASLLTTRVTMGEKVQRFEALWADYVGAGQAVMVNSGSSANLIAAEVLRSPFLPRPLAPGDEVLVPAVAWSTTYFPLVTIGAVPVLVDVDLDTFTLDPKAVEAAIGPRPRAVVAGPPPRHARGTGAGRAAAPLPAPHQPGGGWDGRAVRRAARRPGADAPRPRLAARRAQEARRAEPGHRRALLLRQLRLQPAPDGAAGRVRHPPDAAARAVHPHAARERGVLGAGLREVRRPAQALAGARGPGLALGLVRLPAERVP